MISLIAALAVDRVIGMALTEVVGEAFLEELLSALSGV